MPEIHPAHEELFTFGLDHQVQVTSLHRVVDESEPESWTGWRRLRLLIMAYKLEKAAVSDSVQHWR